MRFMYFVLLIIAIANLLIIIFSGLTGINIYKKYGKAILKAFFNFLFLLLAFYVAIAISGLSS